MRISARKVVATLQKSNFSGNFLTAGDGAQPATHEIGGLGYSDFFLGGGQDGWIL